MNIYVVVEGEGETQIYPDWIRKINPSLKPIDRPDAASQDNYYLISGQGYPNYLDVIRNGLADVQSYAQYDRFVVAIDSEDATAAAKYSEVDQFISGIGCRVPYRIVVQHFCLEAWALGNKRIFHRNPSNDDLKRYIAHFDVSAQDPELLTPPPYEELNRARAAYKYLRLLLREKNPRLIYSKRNPREIGQEHFFVRIRERHEVDHHINSFAAFLTAFV